MKMIRHFQIRVGNWMFTNWHLYRLTEHRDAKTNGKKCRWMMWDKVI